MLEYCLLHILSKWECELHTRLTRKKAAPCSHQNVPFLFPPPVLPRYYITFLPMSLRLFYYYTIRPPQTLHGDIAYAATHAGRGWMFTTALPLLHTRLTRKNAALCSHQNVPFFVSSSRPLQVLYHVPPHVPAALLLLHDPPASNTAQGHRLRRHAREAEAGCAREHYPKLARGAVCARRRVGFGGQVAVCAPGQVGVGAALCGNRVGISL